MSALRAYQDGHPVWIRADDGARAHGSYRTHDSRPVTVIGDMAPRLVPKKGPPPKDKADGPR